MSDKITLDYAKRTFELASSREAILVGGSGDGARVVGVAVWAGIAFEFAHLPRSENLSSVPEARNGSGLPARGCR